MKIIDNILNTEQRQVIVKKRYDFKTWNLKNKIKEVSTKIFVENQTPIQYI